MSSRSRKALAGVAVALVACLGSAVPAGAEEILTPASYPTLSTYKCRSAPLSIQPGQNLNLYDTTTTCPNAVKLSGDGPENPFSSPAQGFITRFEPNMVEVTDPQNIRTPRVDDLHLHHVVWLGPGDIRFAAGEEKTYVKLPQGYGFKVGTQAQWNLNWMIHDLKDIPNRMVQIEWVIDWVPADTNPEIEALKGRWMDVAGIPQAYPVFDAEKGFANTADGEFTFPDEVPTSASQPGFEERSKISPLQQWTVTENGGVTLIFGAGHVHPGGLYIIVKVLRNGQSETIFRSDAVYYEPAGAVSWDVSMKATRPDWRVKLKKNDVVSISATYDVSKASWYESMGIIPFAYVDGRAEPGSVDPFDGDSDGTDNEAGDRDAIRALVDAGGILTHGQLPENIDDEANKPLGLKDPRKLPDGKPLSPQGVKIWTSYFGLGGFSANRGFPASAMRPPVVRPGQQVKFTNRDALPTQSVYDQTWHTITSCVAPCNRGSGIGYPLAGGPVKFDSGQLGYANRDANGPIYPIQLFNSGVVTNSNVFKTPKIRKAGTYSYFCRIHPFMRGSFRVKAKKKRR